MSPVPNATGPLQKNCFLTGYIFVDQEQSSLKRKKWRESNLGVLVLNTSLSNMKCRFEPARVEMCFCIVQRYSVHVCVPCWCGGTHPDGDKWVFDLKVVQEYDTNHFIVWVCISLFHSNEQTAVKKQTVLTGFIYGFLFYISVSLKTWRDVLQQTGLKQTILPQINLRPVGSPRPVVTIFQKLNTSAAFCWDLTTGTDARCQDRGSFFQLV